MIPDHVNGKYIEFRLVARKPKTAVYQVRAKQFNVLLGLIKWYPQWRKYAFYVESDTVFEETCLSDIIKFLDLLKKERSAERRAEKNRMQKLELEKERSSQV